MIKLKSLLQWGLFLVLSFAAINCQTESYPTNKVPKMEFEVLPANLGYTSEHPDLGLKIQIPKGCNAVEGDFSEIMPESIIPYPLNIKAVFQDTSNQTLVVISDISQLGSLDFSKMQQNPNVFLNKKSEWQEIKPVTYLHKKQKITQFLLQNAALVNLKLLIYEGVHKKTQIDYFIPRQAYNAQAKLIESSIGSISFDEDNYQAL